MDSPGILVPKIDNDEVALNLGSMTSIKENVLPIEKVALHILFKLNNSYKTILKENYNLDSVILDNIEEAYNVIGKYRNIHKINGEDDYDKINTIIINDVKSEKIKGITFDKL